MYQVIIEALEDCLEATDRILTRLDSMDKERGELKDTLNDLKKKTDNLEERMNAIENDFLWTRRLK